LLEAETGFNRYKFVMIGSSDMHAALPAPDNGNFIRKTTPDEPALGRST
jgi:hypothetical protein